MPTSGSSKRATASRPAVRERSRRQILEAARALVAERGVDGLTMRVLGERADTSVQTIYSAFGTKQGVIQALTAEEMDRLASEFSAIPVHDPIEALYAQTELLLDSAIEHTGRSLAAAVLGEPAAGTWWQQQGRVASLLGQAIATGLLSEDLPPQELGEHFRSLLTQLMWRWAQGAFSDEDLRERALSGLDVVLLAVATRPTRERLLNQRRSVSAGGV